jgi:hypothetical protein
MLEAPSGTRGQQSQYQSSSSNKKWPKLLAQAQANAEKLAAYRDQEAFIVTIHGTQLRVIAAHFTSTNLAAVTMSFLPTSEVVRVRRSSAFEMKLVANGMAALSMLIGYFRYVKSGAAEIGVCQALSDELLQTYNGVQDRFLKQMSSL